jgi:energy-coupling factor transport system ATP-binding protein
MRTRGIWHERAPVKLDSALHLWKQLDGLRFSLPQPDPQPGRAAAEPVIQVRDLVFSYSDQVMALKGINLEVNRGEFLGLIGQNGSGKTTLVRHLIGLLRPTAGDVIVGGKDTRDLSVGSLSRIVGYVFQNPDHQIFTSSVRKELAYGPTNLGIEPEEVEQIVERVAAALGLEEFLDIDPYQLSRGQRQRVAIGSILTMNPSILVLDEPTTGLYTEEAAETLGYIRTLNEQEQLTVIMISHDMRLVSQYCTRAVVLAEGVVVADDETDRVFHDRVAMRQVSLCPPQITLFAMEADPSLNRAVLSSSELVAAIRECHAVDESRLS